MRSLLLWMTIVGPLVGGAASATFWSNADPAKANDDGLARKATHTAHDGIGRADFRTLRLPGPFPAVVTQVIDGDTFEARVTIWLGHEVTTRVRLTGIDAAERGSVCGDERELAEISRAALARFLDVRVELTDVRFDKYGGRVLARARSREHPDVASRMLAGGFALAYDGGAREPWCDQPVRRRK